MESKCKYEECCQPKVAVLMSAYNGEKYIRQQIDSVLHQTWKNTVLYIRDDGSSDDTLAILAEYEKQGKIVVFKGENQGYIRSFFTLMASCPQADYYAWCDQDDVWCSDKLERAVKILEKDKKEHRGEEAPVLYFADYDYYDEQMHFQKHGLNHKRGPSFENSLMDCISLGFNSVFNQKAKEMMEKNTPKYSCGHDWWTYMVCAAFGRVIYDQGYVSVKYRRIEKSISPGGKSFLAMQIWRFKKFLVNDYFTKIKEQLWEFADLYLDALSEKNAKIMRLFVNRKYSFPLAIKKTLYRTYFRQGMTEEVMVRVLFLIGKL